MTKKTEKFTVPSQLVAAARMMQAKSDVRHYLIGVRINGERVSGTNGHYLFDCPIEVAGIEDELILYIHEAIPRYAVESGFERISKTEFIVRHKDKHGSEISASVAKVVDGEFPDIGKLTDKIGKLEGVEKVAFNMAYADLINKVFKKLGCKEMHGLQCAFRGEHETIEIRGSSPCDYPDAYVLLMPTRT